MQNKKDFSSKPLVSIIILTCNSYSLVNNCLFLVKKLSSKNYIKNVIVVDNGSKNDVVVRLYQNYKDIVIVKNPKNYGFSIGVNIGIRLALDINSDYVFLLNDDTQFKSNFMDQLIYKAQKEDFKICGPQLLTKEGLVWSNGGMIDKNRFSGSLIDYGKKVYRHNQEKVVDFISGTAILIKTPVFEKVGLLDEDYFFYYDDVDFCFRAGKAGINAIIIPSIELIHLESVTIGKNSPLHYYHAAKSRLIFLFKHAPFTIKIRELMRIPKSMIELISEKNQVKKRYEIKAYFDFFKL